VYTYIALRGGEKHL